MGFDKSKFAKTVSLLALRLPKKLCSTFIKAFKNQNVLFTRPGLRTIVDDFDEAKSGGTKLMLLDEKVGALSDPPSQLKKLAEDNQVLAVAYPLKLNFQQLTTEAILRSLLPEGVQVPTSFETVGHVAHLNLKDEQLPHKNTIGEVFLHKNPAIRTVVTKLGTISNEFRVFEMEVIAGANDFETTVKEHACTFKFNYREVYWNSRLQTEHNRLVQLLPSSAVVLDMTAGVGPFAVPLGTRGCSVLANDLNPKSYEYLKTNVALNKVDGKVRTFNMDGRDFARHCVAATAAGSAPAFEHVIINLPALSLDFLDVFVGLFPPREEGKAFSRLPRIHAYCFSNAEDRVTDCLARCSKVLGAEIEAKDAEVRDVRHVAPKKDYMYVSFDLPESVCRSTSSSTIAADATASVTAAAAASCATTTTTTTTTTKRKPDEKNKKDEEEACKRTKV